MSYKDEDSVALQDEANEMNAVLRAMGKVLQLVGISSPEDAKPKPKLRTASDPPSWRDPQGKKPEDRKEDRKD